MKKRTCVPCYGKVNQRLDQHATSLMKDGKVKEANAVSISSITIRGKRADACGLNQLAEQLHRKVNHLITGA